MNETGWGEAAGREHKEALKNLGAMDNSQTWLWGWLSHNLPNCIIVYFIVSLSTSMKLFLINT